MIRRQDVVDPFEVQILHVYNRCVRRAFICGYDPISGNDYSHRKEWLQQRMEYLIGIFAFDIATFAIMSNHFHCVLRSRPDIVATWSDEEVARRNMKLQGKVWFRSDGSDRATAAKEIKRIINDPEELQRIRRKLSDISSFMSYFDEHIAKRSNREDEVTGAFWEGVFGCKVLEDEESILACMAYVDLNPIRAMMAESLEESEYTGIFERIGELRRQLATEGIPVSNSLPLKTNSRFEVEDWGTDPVKQTMMSTPVETGTTEQRISIEADITLPKELAIPAATPIPAELTISTEHTTPVDLAVMVNRFPEVNSVTGGGDFDTHQWERQNQGRIGWLSPIELAATGDGLDIDPSGRRCSRKGFLPISLLKYLEIVEWAGREQRDDKRGSISESLEPIFQRLGFSSTGFLASMLQFAEKDRYFRCTERQGIPERPFASSAS